MSVALHSVLVDGAAADYDRAHARIPDDLRALFDRAGIRDWTIWRSGDRLFHLIDCDDFDAAVDLIGRDPADQRWQADIGRFVAGFHGPDGEHAFRPLREVWSFAEQRRDGRAPA